MRHLLLLGSLLGSLLVVGSGSLALGGCEDEVVDPPPADPFAEIYTSATFQMCADCHSPTAPGFTTGTEATQDWSSQSAAFQTLQLNASGLEGNFAGCNGVPLVGESAATSLVVATLDPTVRANFSVPNFPDCNADAISDHTLVVGDPGADLTLLTNFIEDGGFR